MPDERASATETDVTSQTDHTKKASPTPPKAKGKQRRIRRSPSDAASEDLETTDSDGPRRQRVETGERAAAPAAVLLRTAETHQPTRTTDEEAAPLRTDNDVEKLQKVVQQLAVAVADMQRERQLMPVVDTAATVPDEPALERVEPATLPTRRVLRRQQRTAAPRATSSQRHGVERKRSQRRNRIGRKLRPDHQLESSDSSSDESPEASDSDASERKRHGGRKQRQSATRQRRAAHHDDFSPSDSGSSDDSSDGHDRKRRERGGGNPRRVRRQQPDSDDDDPSEDDSGSDESSASDSERSRSESRERRRRRGPRRQRRRRERHEQRERHKREKSESAARVPLRPGNIKNLELPVFTPAPGVSAATWVDRIDLALEGAKASGQGEWSDHALYFILGNKLMESAAMWWVTMNQGLTRRQQTWTYLKKELLKRFGPRKNKAAAEWRVNNRTMLNGESYDDFAAGLRRAADRNRVSERVFLAQFYRNLDKTTRQLVRMEPRPRTLEEAVAKTNRIDDPADNIAQGMKNIGQAFPMAPQTQLATVAGTMGQTVVIPGVGGMSLPAELTEAVMNSTAAEPANKDAVTVFTNQQGVWNDYAGIYERPPGRKWNGRFWEKVPTKRKTKRSPSTPAEPRKTRAKRTRDESGDDTPQEKTESRKRKTASKPTADTGRSTVARVGAMRQPEAANHSNRKCIRCGSKDHYSTQCPDKPRCYACQQEGHYARDCTNAEAKARNDEYLKQRAAQTTADPGNGERTA